MLSKSHWKLVLWHFHWMLLRLPWIASVLLTPAFQMFFKTKMPFNFHLLFWPMNTRLFPGRREDESKESKMKTKKMSQATHEKYPLLLVELWLDTYRLFMGFKTKLHNKTSMSPISHMFFAIQVRALGWWFWIWQAR